MKQRLLRLAVFFPALGVSGCATMAVPQTEADLVLWACAAIAALVLLTSLHPIGKRSLLRLVLHLLVTGGLLCATVWIVMHSPRDVQGRAVICLLSLGVFIVWTIWAISGFAVGNRPPNDDDDSFLPL